MKTESAQTIQIKAHICPINALVGRPQSSTNSLGLHGGKGIFLTSGSDKKKFLSNKKKFLSNKL